MKRIKAKQKHLKSCITVVCIFLLAGSTALQAQDKAIINVGGELVNRFIWRGMSLNTSPSIQPYIEYNKGGFTLGTWGSYTFAQEPYQEVDVYIDYSFKNISITLNDYFAPVDSLFTNNEYFNWNKGSTSHALEAILTVTDLGGLPLTFTGGVFIYGNDLDENGDNYYSTYLELNYDFNIGDNTVSSFVGITPDKGYYSEQFDVVNAGFTVARDIEITDRFSLPIYGSFIVNPSTENVFMVMGLAF